MRKELVGEPEKNSAGVSQQRSWKPNHVKTKGGQARRKPNERCQGTVTPGAHAKGLWKEPKRLIGAVDSAKACAVPGKKVEATWAGPVCLEEGNRVPNL